MKKILLSFCLSAMLLLAACGQDKAPAESAGSSESAASSAAVSAAEPAAEGAAVGAASEAAASEDDIAALKEQRDADAEYAKQIVEELPISRASLLDHLAKDGFVRPDAEYAADHCGADWKDEALQAARQIVEVQGIKAEKEYILLHLTEAYGFTEEEANYGADTYLAGS